MVTIITAVATIFIVLFCAITNNCASMQVNKSLRPDKPCIHIECAFRLYVCDVLAQLISDKAHVGSRRDVD